MKNMKKKITASSYRSKDGILASSKVGSSGVFSCGSRDVYWSTLCVLPVDQSEIKKEMERRKMGKDVQDLKKKQEEEKMRRLLEERNREKAEEKAARERVKQQIALVRSSQHCL